MEIGKTPSIFNKFKESAKSDFPTINGIIPIFFQNGGWDNSLRIATLKIFNELERCACYSIQGNDFRKLETILRDSGLSELANTFTRNLSPMTGPTRMYRDGTVSLRQQNLCLYLRNKEIDNRIPVGQQILNYTESLSYMEKLKQCGLNVIEWNGRLYDEIAEALKAPIVHYKDVNEVIVLMIGYRHWNQTIDTVLMNVKKDGQDILTAYWIPDILCELKKAYCIEKIVFIQLTIPLADNYPEIKFPPKVKNSYPPQHFSHTHIHARDKLIMDRLLTRDFTENWAKSDDIIGTLHESIPRNDIYEISYRIPLPEKFFPKCVVIFKIVTNKSQTRAIEKYFSINFVANAKRYYYIISYKDDKMIPESWNDLRNITEKKDHYDVYIFVITSKRRVSKYFHSRTVEACNLSFEDSPISRCPKIFIIDAPLSDQKEQIHAPEIKQETLIIASYSDRDESVISCLGRSLAEDKQGAIDFESHVVEAIRDGGREKLDFRSNLSHLIHFK